VRHLGRRSQALLVLAGLWLLMGIVVAVTEHEIDLGDAIAYEAIPIPVRVALWVGTALLAFVVSMRLRWQDWGWMGLALMPAERAISHAWSLGHGLIPGEPPGTTWAGFTSTLLWLGITHLVLILAGWNEDTPTDEAGTWSG